MCKNIDVLVKYLYIIFISLYKEIYLLIFQVVSPLFHKILTFLICRKLHVGHILLKDVQQNIYD